MGVSDLDPDARGRRAWNAGSLVGAKRPLKPRDVWAIRFFLDEHHRMRDRALFDLAIDSKLRGCDVVKIKIGDLGAGGTIRNRATIIQLKTGRPVQFELMTDARASLLAWLSRRGGSTNDFVFPSRVDSRPSEHSTICSPRRRVGFCHRPQCTRLWHAFAASNEGIYDLQGDRQPSCGADFVRPQQD